jgi:hypothetical protein
VICGSDFFSLKWDREREWAILWEWDREWQQIIFREKVPEYLGLTLGVDFYRQYFVNFANSPSLKHNPTRVSLGKPSIKTKSH